MPYKRHLIFKTGVHNPAKGERVWTAEKVRALYENTLAHSPEQIPYTIKHPSNHLPILGFAKKSELKLHERGGEVYLSAVPSSFADAFVELLKRAQFDKPSIAIGQKGEIVHIGLVDKPAVEGVEAAFERASASDVVEEIESSFSIEEAEMVSELSSVMMLFSELMERVKRAFERPHPSALPVGEGAYSREEVEKLKSELESLRAEREAMLREKAEAEKKARRAEFQAFLDKHIDRVPPKYHETLIAVFEDLDNATPRTFSKGDGETETDTSLNRLMAMIAEKKPVMVFGEAATHQIQGESTDALKTLQSQFERAKMAGIYQRSS
jgi:hypothetical protein